MSDVEPHLSEIAPSAPPICEADTALIDSHASSEIKAVSSQDYVSQKDEDDINPRSSKRPRLSPTTDDNEIDFEAAAARALAISLGVDTLNHIPAPVVPKSKQDGPAHAAPTQISQGFANPDQQTRITNLSTVEDLSSQILATLARYSHLEIGEMLFGPPSQRGQDYRALKAKFEQAKRMYLANSPFTSPLAAGFKETEQVDVLRKMNMATFMASIFSGEIGLRIMDINFLDVFVPEGGRLLKAQASIYLELKTQAFIAAKRTAPAILDRVILDLFPTDVESQLLTKRPGAKSLAPSELDFLKRLASRRDILYGDMKNKRLDGLELRYRWDDFSRGVNAYLSKNYDPSNGNKDKSDQPSPIAARAQLQQEQMESQFSLLPNQSLQTDSDPTITSKEPDSDFDMDDFMAQAARAAEIALQGTGHSGHAPVSVESAMPRHVPVPAPPLPPSATPPALIQTTLGSAVDPTLSTARIDKQENVTQVQSEFQQYKPVSAEAPPGVTGSVSEDGIRGIPHRSQTAPTQVLYERARLVTTNKVSPSPRKPNPPSHRRPWTHEEENALMTGLDLVKGPHWSQILAMYGPGGTINESLKDRNQVQLKDKARNLKLFFLKAGIEVPYYLQAVTGDLKTRAPAQAERREARERERNNAEEDDAMIQQDELQLESIDDLDLLAQSVADQEDIHESLPVAPPEGADKEHNEDEAPVDPDEDSFDDMEAMIARAAASVTEALGNR